MRAQVINERRWFHGSARVIHDFEQGAPREGIHFGTRDQAMMRASQFLHEVELRCQAPRRVMDRQDWGKTATGERRRGIDALVYLNRWEGMSTERVMDLAHKGYLDRLDRVSDAKFRELVPEAEDSLLVLHPDIIMPRRIWDRSGELVWEREPIKASQPWEDPCISP